MDMKMRVLKSKIRGLELEGQKIRRKIEKSSGLDRFGWWNVKRELGSYTRAHLLAYGFLRGVPYEKMERNSNSAIDFQLVLKIIHDHASWFEKDKWTLERLNGLVYSPEQPETTPEPKISPPQVTPEVPAPLKSRFINRFKSVLRPS